MAYRHMDERYTAEADFAEAKRLGFDPSEPAFPTGWPVVTPGGLCYIQRL
jgi:hypothetical protein